jgi:hypothetical protein
MNPTLHTTAVALLAAVAAAFLCEAPARAAPSGAASRKPALPCVEVLRDTRHPLFAECLSQAYRSELKQPRVSGASSA